MKKDQSNIDQKLLVLYLLDEISQQGRHKVEAWLDSSEANRTYFKSLEKTWAETGKIDPASIAFDTNRAWDRMAGRISEGMTGARDVERIKNDRSVRILKLRQGTTRILMAVAAVLVLGMVSVVAIRFLQNRQNTGLITLASYSLPVEDTLTDGSTVILNTDTKLIVPEKFAQNSRTVELKGEAFFQVEHDATRPFIIDAGPGQVKVLGTSFQVKAYPDSDLEVYVESGRVELIAFDNASGDTAKIILIAGERGMIRLGSGKISKPAELIPDELFWANKKLVFQETKLSLVFDLLKKHYDADIEVKDTTVLNCLLSATFTDESINQILEVVAASFDLKLSREAKKYIINGKGCSHEDE
jgi:transmembrane sensor